MCVCVGVGVCGCVCVWVCVGVCGCVLYVCSIESDSLGPHGLWPTVSSVHGIFQARILEWVAISYSRGSSQIAAKVSWFQPDTGGDVLIFPLLQLFIGRPGQDASCELNTGPLA